VSAALSMAKVMARPQRAHGSTATRKVDAGKRTGSRTAVQNGGRCDCGLCIVTARRVFGRKTWRPGHVADATVQHRQRRTRWRGDGNGWTRQCGWRSQARAKGSALPKAWPLNSARSGHGRARAPGKPGPRRDRRRRVAARLGHLVEQVAGAKGSSFGPGRQGRSVSWSLHVHHIGVSSIINLSTTTARLNKGERCGVNAHVRGRAGSGRCTPVPKGIAFGPCRCS